MLRGLAGVVMAGAMLALLGVADSSAGQWVAKTACDSVLINGVAYPEVTFEVRNIYPDPDYPIYEVFAVPAAPVPPDSGCRAIGAGAPETWVSYIEPKNNHILWSQASDSSITIFQGQTLDGFRLVLTREYSCCLDFYFAGAFPEPFAHERVCFECAVPVPAIKRSWGALKVLYR